MTGPGAASLRVAIAEDAVLLREGLARVLADAGMDVAGTTAVVVLSQHVETGQLIERLADDPRGVGYLLKDRIADIGQFTGAIRRVAAGQTVIDPDVISRLAARPRQRSPLDDLTEREHDVLALIAQGRSNQAIAGQLHLSPKTVETHIAAILSGQSFSPRSASEPPAAASSTCPSPAVATPKPARTALPSASPRPATPAA